MAVYNRTFQGNYDEFSSYLESSILSGSISASLESKSKTVFHGVTCTVLVFERYSYIGKNRVSLNVTLLGHEDEIQLIAVTSGGSQAVFWKVNTLGEESFIDKLKEPVEAYVAQYQKNG